MFSYDACMSIVKTYVITFIEIWDELIQCDIQDMWLCNVLFNWVSLCSPVFLPYTPFPACSRLPECLRQITAFLWPFYPQASGPYQESDPPWKWVREMLAKRHRNEISAKKWRFTSYWADRELRETMMTEILVEIASISKPDSRFECTVSCP